jgi:hypothetical protein
MMLSAPFHRRRLPQGTADRPARPFRPGTTPAGMRRGVRRSVNSKPPSSLCPYKNEENLRKSWGGGVRGGLLRAVSRTPACHGSGDGRQGRSGTPRCRPYGDAHLGGIAIVEEHPIALFFTARHAGVDGPQRPSPTMSSLLVAPASTPWSRWCTSG